MKQFGRRDFMRVAGLGVGAAVVSGPRALFLYLVFDEFTDKKVAPEMQLRVEHGQPLLFGKERNRGLRLKPGSLELETVAVGENGVSLDDVLVHDETNRTLASLLASLEPPHFPMPIGVLYCDPAPSYEEDVYHQVEEEGAGSSPGLEAMLTGGRTWTVD